MIDMTNVGHFGGSQYKATTSVSWPCTLLWPRWFFWSPLFACNTPIYIYILMIISATSLLLTLCLSFAVTSMNQSFTHLWTWIWLNMKDSPGFWGSPWSSSQCIAKASQTTDRLYLRWVNPMVVESPWLLKIDPHLYVIKLPVLHSGIHVTWWNMLNIHQMSIVPPVQPHVIPITSIQNPYQRQFSW